MIAATLAILLSAALGYAALAAVAPGTRVRAGSLGFGLALGLGLGLSSATVFVWLVLRNRLTTGFVGAEVALLGALAVVALVRRRAVPAREGAGHLNADTSAPTWLLAGALVVVAAALAHAVARTLNHPYGGWDAWSHWNMRAHFLVTTGAHWRDSFHALEGWVGGYPVLLPSLIARGRMLAGVEWPALGAIASVSFAAATVAVLYGGVATLRGRTQGLVAALALLATPYFGEQATAQHSDIPLGFFMLAAVVLLGVAERAARPAGLRALAGLAAACAAWTKNEGMVLLLALGVVEGVVWIVRRPRSGLVGRALPIVLGAAPILLVVAYFKLAVAPPSVRFSEHTTGQVIAKLLTPERYAIVARDLLLECAQYKQCALSLVPGFIVYYWLVGGGDLQRDGAAAARAGGVASLMLAAYAFAFLTSPFDITFDIVFAWNRLLLQVWPTALFAFFLVARVPTLARAPAASPPEPAEA